MADDIIVKIRAEGVDEFAKGLKSATTEADKLGASVTSANQSIGKETQKALGFVESLKLDLKDLKKARDESFNEDQVKIFNKQIADTEKEIKKLTDTTTKAEKSFTKIGKTIAGAFTVAAFIKITKAVGKLATEMDVIEKKAELVFGSATEDVEKFAKANQKSLSTTTKEFKSAATGIGAILAPLGLAKSVLASTSSNVVLLADNLQKLDKEGRSTAEISKILGKALIGDRDALKSLNISVTEADIKMRLLEKGQQDAIGTAKKQAEAIAVVELAMESSTIAIDNVADGTETLKTKQDNIAKAFRQVAQDVGEKVIPIYDKLLDVINDLIEANPAKALLIGIEEQSQQELNKTKELLEVRREDLKERKKAGDITFKEALELTNTIPDALKKINKLEEERTGLIGARRGGATDEQREELALQKLFDEKVANEKELARLEELKKKRLADEKKKREELARIIARGVKEIENSKFNVEVEVDIKAIEVQLAEGLRRTFKDISDEKLKLDFEGPDEEIKSFFEIIEEGGEDLETLLAHQVALTDEANEQVWENEVEREKALIALKEERLTKSVTGIQAIEAIQQTAFAAFSAGIDAEIAQLEERKDKGIISEKEFEQEKAALLNKQAKADRAAAIIEVITNTAKGVVAQLQAGPAGFALAALAAALGAFQLATIVSQPIPKFAEGTRSVERNGAPRGKDTVLAYVNEGERIIPTHKNTKHWAMLNAVEDNNIEAMMKALAGYGVPVQFQPMADRMNMPLKKIEDITKGTDMSKIDWNPLLNSGDLNRRSLGKKLDRVNNNLEKMSRGLTHRMTKN